jgi:hypothetical protein
LQSSDLDATKVKNAYGQILMQRQLNESCITQEVRTIEAIILRNGYVLFQAKLIFQIHISKFIAGVQFALLELFTESRLLCPAARTKIHAAHIGRPIGRFSFEHPCLTQIDHEMREHVLISHAKHLGARIDNFANFVPVPDREAKISKRNAHSARSCPT